MSIVRHAGNRGVAGIVDAESMVHTIRERGILPFFENVIRGYSVEEETPQQFWFDGDDGATLGPWDWKIECVRSGDIAYGKFLLGGKAAFATVPWYAELRNYRRSLPKYEPDADGQRILGYIAEHGSITIREVRALLGVKKAAADAAITRLQMQCRVVTGDLLRVYRGADLRYSGWQVASFCRPEDIFSADRAAAAGSAGRGEGETGRGANTAKAGFADGRPSTAEARKMDGTAAERTSAPFAIATPTTRATAHAGLPSFALRALGLAEETPRDPLDVGHSPEESLRRLREHITALTGETSDKLLMKLLG